MVDKLALEHVFLHVFFCQLLFPQCSIFISHWGGTVNQFEDTVPMHSVSPLSYILKKKWVIIKHIPALCTWNIFWKECVIPILGHMFQFV